MNRRHIALLEHLLAARSRFAEMLALAVLLAFSTSLAASAVFSLFGDAHLAALLIAFLLIFACLVIVGCLMFRGRVQTRKFEGFFVYDPRHNSLSSVPLYEFSDELTTLVLWGCRQDKDLLESWRRAPLKLLKTPGEDGRTKNASELSSASVIQDGTECFLLSALSEHLRAYFENEKHDDPHLRKMTREDAAPLVLENRILEVISRPLTDRPSMLPEGLEGLAQAEGVLEWVGEHGFFRRFELLLPADTTLERVGRGQFNLRTRRMYVTFAVSFSGDFANVLPADFVRHVLGEKDPFVVSDYEVVINVTARFRYAALLTPTGWKYYQWFDSFLEQLENSFGGVGYLGSIGWPTACTILNVLRPEHKEQKAENPTKPSSATSDSAPSA